MSLLEKIFNSKIFSISILFIFITIIQEPSLRLFSAEIHYIGEGLQKILNIFPNKYSSYYQYESFISYRLIFDIIVSIIYQFTNDILLTANLGRVFLALLFTYSIYHFSKSLNINLITVLAAISSFMLMNQQLVGGEKIFGNGFQSSALSYSLLILSISYYLRDNIIKSFLCIILSIYLHFLIGGYWALFILLSILFLEKKIKTFSLFLFFLIISCAPLLYSIYVDTFHSQINISDVAETYAYRSKHHFLPFYSLIDFLWWIPGFVMIFFFMCYGFYAVINNYDKKINFLIILCASQILISLFVSIFDTNLYFANLDPFRSSSVLLFLIFFSLFKRLYEANLNFFISFILIIPLCINVLYPAIGRIAFESPQVLKSGFDNGKKDLIEFIQNNTDNNNVVINVDNLNLVDIEIKTKRPTYFNWKIVPTKSKLLLEWNRRYNTIKNLSNLNCKSDKYAFIDILILNSKNNNFDICGKIIYHSKRYKLVYLKD